MQCVADDAGVWRIGDSGRRSGIRWDEVHCGTAHKLDLVTSTGVCVVFDFEYGEFVEFHDTFVGFPDVAAALVDQLDGVSHDWVERATAMTVNDPPLLVWARQVAGPAAFKEPRP